LGRERVSNPPESMPARRNFHINGNLSEIVHPTFLKFSI
jgi:hypothetical protein